MSVFMGFFLAMAGGVKVASLNPIVYIYIYLHGYPHTYGNSLV